MDTCVVHNYIENGKRCYLKSGFGTLVKQTDLYNPNGEKSDYLDGHAWDSETVYSNNSFLSKSCKIVKKVSINHY